MILQAKSATLLTWLITLIAVCSVSPSLDVQPRGVITVGHAAVVDAGMPRESTQLRLRGGRRSIDLSEAVPVTEEDDLVPTKPDRVCASCQALAHAGEDFMRCGWCHATWYAYFLRVTADMHINLACTAEHRIMAWSSWRVPL